jgi:hypothetical protein
MPKNRSQKYQQTKISTLTISLMKNIKIKFIFLIIVNNNKIAQVVEIHQIKPNYSINTESSKKNGEPKFKYFKILNYFF